VDLLGMAHHIAGSEGEAIRLYELSVDLFTELGERRGLANALTLLSVCGPSLHTCAAPCYSSARRPELLASERAVRTANEIGWRAGEAFARYLTADCFAWHGEYERALRLVRESLGIAEEIEHLEWQCGALRVLGVIALDLCAPADAVTHLEMAYAIARRLGSAVWIRWTAAPLAIALARSAHPDRARDIIDDVDQVVAKATRPEWRTLGERYLAIARAEVAIAAGAPDTALATVSEQDAKGTPVASFVRARALTQLERWEDATATLGAARDDAQRFEGRPLLWRVEALQGSIHLGQRRRLEARRSFETARSIATALVAELDEPKLVAALRAGLDMLAPASPAPTAAQAAKAAYGGLTRRERDTAALIVQGKSNRAIARALGIAERTVEGYVAAALAKLGFSSRAQLAVWAAEQGLGKESSAGRPRR